MLSFDIAIDPASIAFVTAVLAMVVANEPVPEPVTLPVSVMVWSPVLVPLEVPENVPLWVARVPSPKVVRPALASASSIRERPKLDRSVVAAVVEESK